MHKLDNTKSHTTNIYECRHSLKKFEVKKMNSLIIKIEPLEACYLGLLLKVTTHIIQQASFQTYPFKIETKLILAFFVFLCQKLAG